MSADDYGLDPTPRADDAEQSVLGGILLNNDKLDDVADVVLGLDFYSSKHRTIYTAMLDLQADQEPIDLVTLSARLRATTLSRGAGPDVTTMLEAVGGEIYLAKLLSVVPTAANIRHYAKQVAEAAARRRVIAGARAVASLAADDAVPISDVRRDLDALATSTSFDVSKPTRPLGEAVANVVRSTVEMARSGRHVAGVPTGFADVDDVLLGMHGGDLIILAARPSVGKTTLALNIARNAARAGHPVLILSLEMTEDQVATRALSSEALVDSQDISSARLSPDDIDRLHEAVTSVAALPMAVCDKSGLDAAEVRARARKFARTIPNEARKRGLIVVDYLQLMSPPSGLKEQHQQVGENARLLKHVAKEMGWPLLALSQLNRRSEEREEGRPKLSDLRASGNIEEHADVVMLLWRTERTWDVDSVSLAIEKNRNGPTNVVELVLQKKYTRFEPKAGRRDDVAQAPLPAVRPSYVKD